MIWLALIVVAAVAVMAVVEWRSRRAEAATVVEAGAAGLADGDGRLVGWDQVYEVAVLTRRSGWRSTSFSLEVHAEGAPVLAVRGDSGVAEPFLAETHRLPGFDHAVLQDALVRRERRVVVFSR